VGLEALARWRHPERGLVSPGAFIPLAERVGFIDRVGRVVGEQAIRQLDGWHREFPGVSGLLLFLNLSAKQLTGPESTAEIERWLSEAGISASQVIVEITESAFLQASERVDDLKALGLQVYIDDFGTGHSTFTYLRELDVDGLKIDMSFVHGMTESRSDAAIVESIATLGRELGLLVVAEGIETEAQREAVTAAGCVFGQGYFYARPAPPEEFNGWLKAGGLN
jgi:EAL domain-containing protein (putative c-di-GMP-specific phosphodiesterase class I)